MGCLMWAASAALRRRSLDRGERPTSPPGSDSGAEGQPSWRWTAALGPDASRWDIWGAKGAV